VASALLAAAEWTASKQQKVISGNDFLVALTAGIEVECKVGLGVWPEHYDVGWHITSTAGSIGAAAAVAKLLSLSESETAHAIGIAATQVTGLREMFGSHTKSFHPGRSAQNGLLAAFLAKEGYTSSEQALEAKRGWANVVGATKTNVQENLAKWVGLSGDLGLPVGTVGANTDGGDGRWEILRNSFKPFPCGIVIHPIIDACAQLHIAVKDRVDQIDKVHVMVHPLVLELTGKRTPQDGLQAKFSVYHGGACGLIFGKATPSQYDDAVVRDQEVIAVRDRIVAEVDSSLSADEAIAVVTLKDGTRLEKHVIHAVGSLEVPLDDKRLEDKFYDQCVGVLGAEDTKAASDALWSLGETTDITSITKLL
jgi:aconitate decarboxylase